MSRKGISIEIRIIDWMDLGVGTEVTWFLLGDDVNVLNLDYGDSFT